jgi:hypothetical protein
VSSRCASEQRAYGGRAVGGSGRSKSISAPKSKRTSEMTKKTFRMLLKAIAALAITATFGSASFAGEFTVHQGKRYCATLALNSDERLADNALIARKFRALGFSKVRVSGTGAMRRVEGVWHRKDASTTLPRQIVAVAGL